MDVTIALTVLKRKIRKDGLVPVYIRYTELRKSRYKATGIAIPEKDWNPDRQEVRKSHIDYKVLNIKLGKILRNETKNRDALIESGHFSLEKLISLASKKSPSELGIYQYCTHYRDLLKAEERYWEWRHFKVLMRDIENYQVSVHKNRLEDLNTEWLALFQKHLLEKNVPNSPVTVRKKLQRFRGMVKWLLKNKLIDNDPYLNLDRVKLKKTGDSKVKLSFEQIKSLQSLDLKIGTPLWHTRNYFLYSFYNAGIRFSDLCCLKWRDIIDGRLEYNMHKTGGYKKIKQTEEMLKILDSYRKSSCSSDEYIFPILDKQYSDPLMLRMKISSKNVIANKNLQKLAKKAGIESHVTFHVARHSFAHHALRRGMTLYDISKALGHSDLKITQEYLKSFDEEMLDKAMEGLFQ